MHPSRPDDAGTAQGIPYKRNDAMTNIHNGLRTFISAVPACSDDSVPTGGRRAVHRFG